MAKYPDEKLYLQQAAKGQPSGFSTAKNVAEWSARASANSGPKIAPGDGKKTAPAPMRGPLPAD
jgi:hypothetical protein